MELRVLRYFLAVAKEETVSGAAAAVHVSQPALSRQLMDMEEELGKKLFIRGNRKITLTEAGLLLKKRAQEVMDLLDKTKNELSQEETLINGDITIGAGETEAMRLIAEAARSIQTENPGIRYHLFSGNGDDVRDKLDKGLFDFGLLIEPADVTKYNFFPLPLRDIWGLLMRKDSPLAQKDVIRAADLRGIPLILSSQSLVENTLSDWAVMDFGKLNVVATYNLIFNASLFVEEGLGYALTLDKLVNTSEGSCLCFRPLSPRLEAKLNIVWKKHTVLSRAAHKFITSLESHFFQNRSR